MRITDLVDEVDLPTTRVAETAWVTARRRMVRRRSACAVGGVVVTAAVVTTASLPHHDAAPTPAPAPVASSDDPTTPASPAPARVVVGTHGVTAAITQDLLTPDRRRDLVAGGGEHANPDVPVRTTPPGRTFYAYQAGPTTIYAIGEDDHRHLIEVPRQARASYPVSPLRETSLSPDHRQLALSQPGALLVVDLTTGERRRYPVGSDDNVEVAWDGEQRVLVQDNGSGWLVDLATGDVSDGPSEPTTYTPDGPLTWGDGDITMPDGTVVQTLVHNNGGAFPAPPRLIDGLVFGLTILPDGTTGVVAVDPTTGNPVAFLPTGTVIDETTLEGASLTPHGVLLGLPVGTHADVYADPGIGRLLVRWGFRDERLDGAIEVPAFADRSSPYVAWSGPSS